VREGRAVSGPRLPTSPFAPRAEADPALAQFAADVQYYLTQEPRQLPSQYLYDELGSALFDAICQLPWYAITRAELRLLAAHGAELFRHLGPPSTIVELGPGDGSKLRSLLEAGGGAQSKAVDVHLVDVSPRALEASARLLDWLDHVRVVTHASPYEVGLREAVRGADRRGPTLVLFLGSNIGNFDPPGAAALLHSVRAALTVGDAFLLGADLVKPERALLMAYDDPLGVTAAFNRNLLVRINRELGGDFNLDRFGHQAVWNAEESRIEMHLVARIAQHVRIPAAHVDFPLASGERIWTESSYKYRPGDIVRLLEEAGFRVVAQWLDDRDQFALTLVQAA
jgi:L-histidine Nalpha-methyltransferase